LHRFPLAIILSPCLDGVTRSSESKKMPLPDFNENGDLPPGMHVAAFDEVVARFGVGLPQRQEVTARFRVIFDLAIGTNCLERLVIFGSYVSAVAEPNDVDIILVMRDDFRPENCPAQSRVLFDHQRADNELGASVFWLRPDMLIGEPLDGFLSHWQFKRDGQRRGIVEIRP